MSVPTLPDVFRQLFCLAEVRGAPEAYDLKTAVDALDRLNASEIDELMRRVRSGPFAPVRNLSHSVIERLHEVAVGGVHAALEAARARIPALLRRLLDLGIVTHDQAATLAGQLGVVTLPDLLAAIEEGRVVSALGTSSDRLSRAAKELARDLHPLTLGRAFDVLTTAQELIAAHVPAIDEVVFAGDARRFEPLVSSPVLVARAAHPSSALDTLAASPGVDDVLHRTGRRAIVVIESAEVDVRVAAPDDYGSVLFAATGPSGHLRAVHRRRQRPALSSREEEVYRHAGLPWIPPEMRHGTGELEAAAAGRLPRLIERSDIRGDLHMHSTYSDGQDTIESMVSAAAAIGYEYVAITDHSVSAAATRTVTLDQLARQRDEIERLRASMPQITILHGIEVDILPDGRLDFADAVLDRLDIVLASLHDPAGHDGQALTRRCLRAIRHPLVNVITHPANRLVGRRGGYEMDYEAIFGAAVETGTALEIDGAPSHLDLDGEQARAAVAAGVTVTIDSDCHRARALERQMTLGVGTARRGWVEPRHVLNTQPVEVVKAFVAAKRS